MVDTPGVEAPPPNLHFPPPPHTHTSSLLLPGMGGSKGAGNPAPTALSWVNKRKGMRQVCLAAPAYPSSPGDSHPPACGVVFWGLGRETLSSAEAAELSLRKAPLS